MTQGGGCECITRSIDQIYELTKFNATSYLLILTNIKNVEPFYLQNKENTFEDVS